MLHFPYSGNGGLGDEAGMKEICAFVDERKCVLWKCREIFRGFPGG